MKRFITVCMASASAFLLALAPVASGASMLDVTHRFDGQTFADTTATVTFTIYVSNTSDETLSNIAMELVPLGMIPHTDVTLSFDTLAPLEKAVVNMAFSIVAGPADDLLRVMSTEWIVTADSGASGPVDFTASGQPAEEIPQP